MTPPSFIKVGILVNEDSVPFWIAHSIRQLLDSGCACITVILRNDKAGPDATQPRARAEQRCATYRIYEKFDARLKRLDPAFDSTVMLDELLPDIEQVAVEDAQAHDMDILFNASASIPDMALCRYPVYGLWFFCDGDSGRNGAGSAVYCAPDGFRELTSAAPTTSVSLRVVSQQTDQADKFSSNIISSSHHLPDILLLGRQRQNVLMQANSQFPKAIEHLSRVGGQRFFAEVAARGEQELLEAATAERPLHNYPDNWQTCRHLVRHALRYVRRKLRKLLFFEQWGLLIHYSADNNANKKHCMELDQFTEIIPPDDQIWADPFVVPDASNSKTFHIFIEEMPFGNSCGHISVLTVDEQGNHKDAIPIIKRPYHMSYPFIFEYLNNLYMIPETGGNRTIELYRCVEIPHQWEFVKNLMEDKFAVDTTLHHNAADGQWWMFTTIRQNQHTNCLDELHLFHADSPLSSEWQAHPLNPVSRDVTRARPAGALFTSNNEPGAKLYRPSQFGGYHYGWGININEVTRLDAHSYEETTLRLLEPGWRRSALATHTLNYANGMTVSDVRKLRFRWLASVRRVIKRISGSK